jgi:hypothetical protein
MCKFNVFSHSNHTMDEILYGILYMVVNKLSPVDNIYLCMINII